MAEKGLGELLERYYRDFDFAGRLKVDPLRFPRRYQAPDDQETAALLSACLAYGKADLFGTVLERILSLLGEHPAAAVSAFRPVRDRRRFAGIRYRFNANEDLLALLHSVGAVLRKHGSLKACFLSHFRSSDQNVGAALDGFVADLRAVDASAVYGAKEKPAGFLQLLPRPSSGSACKRMNLFLRWVVRDQDIDLGLWRDIPKDRLIIPLDVHIMRVSWCLGLTGRKAQDWTTAVEITESLKRFDPRDPMKFDFALCHHGMSGLCEGPGERPLCRQCLFRAWSRRP